MKFLLLITLMAGLNASCGGASKPKWEYLVDNPLEKDITIKIDEKEYIIPGLTTMPVEIAQGRHTLTCNGSSARFVTKVNSDACATLMNPTLSNYMLHGYVFGLYEQNGYEYHSESGVVKLPVQVVNSLFVERTHTYWSFGLDEDAASALRAVDPSKQVVYKKLFREADYRKEFEGELPPGIVFPSNTGTLNNQPAYAFPVDSLMCDCEGANEAIRALGKQCDDAIAHSDNLFREIEKLSYTAATAVYAEMEQKCGTQHTPGNDGPGHEDTFRQLIGVMKYLTDASTFIVK